MQVEDRHNEYNDDFLSKADDLDVLIIQTKDKRKSCFIEYEQKPVIGEPLTVTRP